MEAHRAKEEINVLRRLIAYSEKVFPLSREVVAPISDRRPEPRRSTAAVVKSSLVMFWARIGSRNALELTAGSRFWKTWLGEPAGSADSLGRVTALREAEGLRSGIQAIYDRLKRNKALPDQGGLGLAVLDGHESHASYRRHCAGCLERTTGSGETKRTQ